MGGVRTVVPDQQQQYLIGIRSDLGLLRMQQYARAHSAALRGTVLLKKAELSVLGKIFY